MIKIIITLTAMLITLVANAQTTGKIAQGDFNGKLCDIGRGLCTITPPSTTNKSTTMKNYTTYKKAFNVMLIELDTNTLSVEDQKKFFGKEYSKITTNETLSFIQDADFEFDFDTLVYLDLDYRYKYLKKGEYPLQIIKDKVQITFTLSRY